MLLKYCKTRLWRFVLVAQIEKDCYKTVIYATRELEPIQATNHVY